MLSNVSKHMKAYAIFLLLFSLIGIASLTYMHSSSTNNTIDTTDNFHDGLALVQKAGKWGYIDKSGKYAIPLQFDKVENFADGLARVQKAGEWIYIDKTGRTVAKP